MQLPIASTFRLISSSLSTGLSELLRHMMEGQDKVESKRERKKTGQKQEIKCRSKLLNMEYQWAGLVIGVLSTISALGLPIFPCPGLIFFTLHTFQMDRQRVLWLPPVELQAHDHIVETMKAQLCREDSPSVDCLLLGQSHSRQRGNCLQPPWQVHHL